MVQSSWREATKPKIRAQLACSTITVKVAVNYLQIKEQTKELLEMAQLQDTITFCLFSLKFV